MCISFIYCFVEFTREDFEKILAQFISFSHFHSERRFTFNQQRSIMFIPKRKTKIENLQIINKYDNFNHSEIGK